MASNPHLQMPILRGGDSVLGVSYEAFEFDICIDRSVTNARLLVDFKTNMFGFMGVETFTEYLGAFGAGSNMTVSQIAAPKGRFAFRKLNKDGSIAFQVIMEGYIGYMCKIHEPLLPDLTDSDLAQIFSNRNACMFSSNLAGGTPIYGVASSSDLPSISLYMSGNTYSAGVSFSSLSGNTPKRVKFGVCYNATKNAVAMRGETSSSVTGSSNQASVGSPNLTASAKAHNLGSVLAIKGSGSIPRSTKTAPTVTNTASQRNSTSSVFDGPLVLLRTVGGGTDSQGDVLPTFVQTIFGYANTCPGNGVGRALGIDPSSSAIDKFDLMSNVGGSIIEVPYTKGLIGSSAGWSKKFQSNGTFTTTINYPSINLYERVGVYQTPYASKITRLTRQEGGGDHVVEWSDADKKFV